MIVYNCKVVLNKHDGIGAGFIKQVTGTTNHNNINLVRAYVYNHHDETIPEQKYYQDDNGSGNAYAGTTSGTTFTGNWTNQNVYIAPNGDDEHSGIKSITYTVNAGTPTSTAQTSSL